MIFAIYRGVPDEAPNTGPGSFTKGRLYLASPEVDDKVVVDVDKLRMRDDTGEDVWIDPESDRFEYPDEVFGVIIEALGPKMPGEVVTVIEADDDGEFVSIAGMGFVRSTNVQLLDSMMVEPGMMVYDRSLTRWCRVRRVDECMRVQVEGSDDMRECSEFIFAVNDGDLAVVPLLRCLNDDGRDNIRQGSIYRVRGLDGDGMLVVEDDNGDDVSFEPSRFEFI